MFQHKPYIVALTSTFRKNGVLWLTEKVLQVSHLKGAVLRSFPLNWASKLGIRRPGVGGSVIEKKTFLALSRMEEQVISFD